MQLCTTWRGAPKMRDVVSSKADIMPSRLLLQMGCVLEGCQEKTAQAFLYFARSIGKRTHSRNNLGGALRTPQGLGGLSCD